MAKKFYDPRFDGQWPLLQAATMTGAAYSGTMTIAASEVDGHTIQWKTTAGDYEGIGLVYDGRLFLAFGTEEGYGLAVYTPTEEGIECGFTSQAFKGAVGREKVLGCKGFDHLDQTYSMQGWQPDHIAYKGKVAFAAYGPLFLVTWAFDGSPGNLVGAGMVRHGRFVVGYGQPNVYSFGCGCYELLPQGGIRGEWAIPSYQQTTIETYGNQIAGTRAPGE